MKKERLWGGEIDTSLLYVKKDINYPHISQKYIEDAAARAEGEFQAMTEAMRRDLNLVSGWGAAGKLSLADTNNLNDLLFPMLRREPLLFGISVVDTDGNSYYVANTQTGWRTSRTGDSNGGRRTVRKFWDANRQLVSEEITPSQYDPRQRPWFHPALSTEDVYWTTPYKFYDHEDVGITGAVACAEPKEGKQLIVALYLRFTIVAMDDKSVGVVSCDRSPEPVFLTIGKNEAFYIRNGPSCDELPVSKVVAYIQNRR